MKKIVLLKGCAGLGNRLFTLVNAAHYAHQTNRKLIVDWNDGLYFPMDYNFFHDFFYLDNVDYTAPQQNEIADALSDKKLSFVPKIFKDKPEQDIYHNFISVHNSLAIKIHARLPKWKIFSCFGGSWIHNKYTNANHSSFPVYLKNIFNGPAMPFGANLSKKYAQDVVVYADFIPFVEHEIVQRYFRLNDNLEAIMKDWSDKFSIEQCIGVHVRSTDLKPSKDVNRLVTYLKEHHPESPVFLATDNSEVETLFHNNFSDIRSIKKEISNDQNRGIHQIHIDKKEFSNEKQLLTDALSDMILLSRTKTLFYQGNSSFSTFSAKLRSMKASFDWQKIENL